MAEKAKGRVVIGDCVCRSVRAALLALFTMLCVRFASAARDRWRAKCRVFFERIAGLRPTVIMPHITAEHCRRGILA
uniref:Putative secreted peptide n=1 Tax=Anopheles braziliensis TaxID=58242 RepID=A0A2M3ZX88_9DIPT